MNQNKHKRPKYTIEFKQDATKLLPLHSKTVQVKQDVLNAVKRINRERCDSLRQQHPMQK